MILKQKWEEDIIFIKKIIKKYILLNSLTYKLSFYKNKAYKNKLVINNFPKINL